MAISKSNVQRGRVGDKVFRYINGQQVVSQAPVSVKQPRTEAQMAQRSKWPNVIANYSAFKAYAPKCFEFKSSNMSDYNRFVQVNLSTNNVYIDKSISQQRGCVAACYIISQGSLDSIAVTGSGASAVSDISLGGLTIQDTTKVCDFARAIIGANGDRFKYGDQISFFEFVQLEDATTGVPYVKVIANKVQLIATDERALYDVVSKDGFSQSGNKLAAGNSLPQCTFAWVHSRKTSTGKTLVSTQRLQNNNDMLTTYTTGTAMTRSMQSYGLGGNIYISPDGNTTSGSTTESGGGSDSGSGGGGSDSGSGGGGSDSGSGGGSLPDYE